MVTVRKTQPADAAVLRQLIVGLAEYEKLPPPDEAAQERLVNDLFAERPRVESMIAEVDGTPAGYTFFFETYSTFLALPILFLEDLFVLPEFRGQGAGAALFRAMAQEAFKRGCGRFRWEVLDWNQPAIDFYERFGATQRPQWLQYQMKREELERVFRAT